MSKGKVIPFLDLKEQYKKIRGEINSSIKNVFKESQFIQGKEVPLFEKEFAEYLGVDHCISVNSGTDGLILGIRALNLNKNDEIIVPSNTFIATALGVSENGLKPVFVDIDEKDFGINLNDLKTKINSRTKAIIVVHLFGQPDKIDEIRDLIKSTGRKIYLIEDACQAHGAEYKGEKVGNFGLFSVFSFYPGKNLGAYGDGGAIVTNDKKLAKKYQALRQYGSFKKYYHENLGINSRLDTIQAAILRVKLRHLDQWNYKRQKIAKYYSRLFLERNKQIITPKMLEERKSVFHIYPILVKRRETLIKYLLNKKITTLIHYPIPLHLQNAYKYLNYKLGDLPIVEKISNQILSLPMYPELKEKNIKEIVKQINSFYEKD